MMAADLMFIPQTLPVVDINDSNDFTDDLFDPLPLDAQNSSSDLLSDLLIMEDAFISPKKTMKRCRRVSFDAKATEISIPSFACLGEDERRGLWYLSGEIERFRTVVRRACRVLRKDPNAFPAEATRGLELRTSQNRQMRKHLAISAIIKAQVRYPNIDPVHLAAIADRCTALPREEALVQGTRDFCDAYSSFLPFTPDPNVLKRGPSLVEDEQGPMKRRRFLAPQENQFPLVATCIAYQ